MASTPLVDWAASSMMSTKIHVNNILQTPPTPVFPVRALTSIEANILKWKGASLTALSKVAQKMVFFGHEIF